MRPSVVLVALAAVAGAQDVPVCAREMYKLVWPPRYLISAPGVPDVPGICGGLWANLQRFSDCITPSNTYCGEGEDGDLEWHFTVSLACNHGMVESTWWEATQNQWGALECFDMTTDDPSK